MSTPIDPISPMNRRSLQVGSLRLELELDATGSLHKVNLPPRVPADFDAATLANVFAELEKYTLDLEGAPFMQKVWGRMLSIPWGQALTYGELAAEAGSPKASRAVGQACARNRLPLIVPCHRVLADAGLGGFAFGLEWKTKLLELESEPRP